MNFLNINNFYISLLSWLPLPFYKKFTNDNNNEETREQPEPQITTSICSQILTNIYNISKSITKITGAIFITDTLNVVATRINEKKELKVKEILKTIISTEAIVVTIFSLITVNLKKQIFLSSENNLKKTWIWSKIFGLNPNITWTELDALLEEQNTLITSLKTLTTTNYAVEATLNPISSPSLTFLCSELSLYLLFLSTFSAGTFIGSSFSIIKTMIYDKETINIAKMTKVLISWETITMSFLASAIFKLKFTLSESAYADFSNTWFAKKISEIKNKITNKFTMSSNTTTTAYNPKLVIEKYKLLMKNAEIITKLAKKINNGSAPITSKIDFSLKTEFYNIIFCIVKNQIAIAFENFLSAVIVNTSNHEEIKWKENGELLYQPTTLWVTTLLHIGFICRFKLYDFGFNILKKTWLYEKIFGASEPNIDINTAWKKISAQNEILRKVFSLLDLNQPSTTPTDETMEQESISNQKSTAIDSDNSTILNLELINNKVLPLIPQLKNLPTNNMS